jgi:hypothetical protein
MFYIIETVGNHHSIVGKFDKADDALHGLNHFFPVDGGELSVVSAEDWETLNQK